MSVTTNIIGPNAAYINFVYGDDYEGIFAQLIAYVTQHGWALFDTVSSVDKIIVSTAPTLKYVRLALATDTISINAYESWSVSNKVGTNQCAVSNNTMAFNNTIGGSLYVFVTKDHLILCNRPAGIVLNAGSWAGVLGVDPINDRYPDAPNFGYATHASLVGEGLLLSGDIRVVRNLTAAAAAAQKNAGRGYRGLYIPRSAQNEIGTSAADVMNVCIAGTESYVGDRAIASYQALAQYYGSTSLGASGTPVTAVYQPEDRLYERIPTTNDPVTGKPRCYTPFVKEMQAWNLGTTYAIRGKIFGPKILTSGTGVFGDVIDIACDSKLLAQEGGTPVPHMIIPCPIADGSSYASYAIPL